MKKLSILAFAMSLIAFTACSEKKAPAPAQAEQTVVTDSAFQAAAAGEYKSADGERSVTLNSDFSVKVKGLNKEFYKWELPAKPEGKENENNVIVNYVVPEGKLKGLGFNYMFIDTNYNFGNDLQEHRIATTYSYKF